MLRRLRELSPLLFPLLDSNQPEERDEYERFAVPYVFSPRLRVVDAIRFALGALARIFLGSLTFALWGTGALIALSTIHPRFLSYLVATAMLAGFLVSLALVLIAITLLGKALNRKKQ